MRKIQAFGHRLRTKCCHQITDNGKEYIDLMCSAGAYAAFDRRPAHVLACHDATAAFRARRYERTDKRGVIGPR